MKYFVTGGAGFIGSNIVHKLLQDKNNCITIYDNFSSGRRSHIEDCLKDKRVRLIEGDLLNLSLLDRSIKGHDFVFHFAANADIAKSMIVTDLDLKLGIITTYNVVEAMRINGIKMIAYSSGSGIYGDVGKINTSENYGPLVPISMYGASKLGAEGIISAFSHLYDMKAWIFRFANMVGKRQTHGICFDFIRKLKQEPTRLEILGDGTQSKSYIHVSDVIEAMLFIIKNTKNKVNIFNVATDSYITVTEIAKIVVEEMGLNKVKFVYTGGDRGWKGDVPIVRFDLTKIHTLGWKAKYNSREAITLSIKELLKEL